MKHLNRRHRFGVLIIVFITILILNLITPLAAEDYALSVTPYFDHYTIIKTIEVCANKVIQRASTWNIRLGELLSIIVTMSNNVVFRVLNACCFCLYILLIAMYSNGSTKLKKITAKSITLAALIVYVGMPVFAQLFLWRTGSTNYLWALTLLLAMHLPIYSYMKNQEPFPSKSKVIFTLYLMGCFLSGLSNENTVIVFLALDLFFAVVQIRRKCPIPKWILYSDIFLLAGYALLFLAPSTKIRRAYYAQVYHTDTLTLGDKARQAARVLYYFVKEGRIIIAFLVIFAILYLYAEYRGIQNHKAVIQKFLICNYEMIAFLILSLGAVAAFFFNPYFEVRGFFMPYTIFIIGTVYFAEHMNLGVWNKIGGFISIVLILLVSIYAVIQIIPYKTFVEKRENEMISAHLKGKVFQWYSYQAGDSRFLFTGETYMQGHLDNMEYYYDIVITE